MQMCLRSFLMAIVAITAVLTSAPAEADTIDPCTIRQTLLPAGAHGVISTPEVVKSNPGQYVFVDKTYTTEDDPSVFVSSFWYVCQPGVQLKPGWAARIKFYDHSFFKIYVKGTFGRGLHSMTQIILIAPTAPTDFGQVPSVLRGGVLECDNVEDCLKTAIARRPEAFVQPTPLRQ